MATKNLSLKALLERVSQLLEESQIRHIVIGGIAVGLRGYPRSTVDIDMLVDGAVIDRARQALETHGFICETETGETLHFVGAGPVDFLIAKRAYSLNMLENADNVKGIRPKVATVEDLIGLKIQAYCNDPRRKWKDQADIAGLIHANPALDWQRILVYARLFDQEAELDSIRRGVKQ